MRPWCLGRLSKWAFWDSLRLQCRYQFRSLWVSCGAGDSRVSLPPFLGCYCVVVEVEISSQPGEEIVAVEHTNEAAFEVLPVPGDDAVGLYAQ